MKIERLRSDLPIIINDKTQGQVKDLHIDISRIGVVPSSDNHASEDIFEAVITGSCASFSTKQIASEAIKQDDATGSLWKKKLLYFYNYIDADDYVSGKSVLPLPPQALPSQNTDDVFSNVSFSCRQAGQTEEDQVPEVELNGHLEMANGHKPG